jgi:hypothetical protein
MTHGFRHRLTIATLAVALISVGAAAAAQDKKAAGPSVAGTWNMTLMSHQVALELTQTGKAVTGTLMMMGKDVPVEGEFVDRVLTLVGVGAKVGGDQHGGEAVALKLTGKLLEDDTLKGEFATARGPAEWTAERLGK